jgi:hypothetical protein
VRAGGQIPKIAFGDSIWGYGRYGADQLLPLSHDDIRHDTAGAVRALRGLALPDRSIILLVSKVADMGHLHPVQAAARELGHIVANADASIGDVERVAMFVRVLPIAAVIGVNVEMLGGMADSGLDPAGVLSGVPVIVALGAACDQLVEAGVDALRLELLGPVLAMECRSRRLHIDGVQWSIEEMGGTLRVSNLAPRALSVRSFDTGRHGRVTAEICPCARFDPVIELAAEGGGTPA